MSWRTAPGVPCALAASTYSPTPSNVMHYSYVAADANSTMSEPNVRAMIVVDPARRRPGVVATGQRVWVGPDGYWA
jgi:hypothetical protein